MQNRFTNEIMSASRVELWRRAVSFVLALLLFASNVPFDVFSVGNTEQGTSESVKTPSGELTYDYDTLKITRDGKDITNLSLYGFEKIEIAASGVSEEATYQWQVQHPEKEDVWVNIYDGTKQTIGVSLALVENVLQKNGYAKLRCRAYTDTYAYLSNTITVQVLEQETLTTHNANVLRGSNDQLMPLADEPGVPEFVTITIEYIRFAYIQQTDGTFVEEEVGQAFTPYIATLKSNTSLNNREVHCPSIVGYEPKLVKVTEGGVDRTPDPSEYNDTKHAVIINQNNITADVVYRVEYHPALVDYEVRYFFQNIYDDLYVEDTSITSNAGIDNYPVISSGYTGLHPDKGHTEKVFDGFTSLYYEPETIAADGSTVFHVYYERNYYLMEFDCNEGYGTDTLYVRYGTYISVPNPVRSGYKFSGWDLVQTGQLNPPDLGKGPDANGRYAGDGTSNDLPKAMPAYNSAYKALWEQADTTYTVAYWILDSDGSRSYIGGRTVGALSGDPVDGQHDLDIVAICNLHDHSDACYNCGLSTHKHSEDCFENMSLAVNDPGNGLYAIQDLETPENGYIYVVYSHLYGRYWPKLYLEDNYGNGSYYVVNNVEGGYAPDSFSSIVDGDELASKTGTYGGEQLTVRKYKAKTSCGNSQHIHDSSCRTCTEHTHTTNCYQDTRFLEEVVSYTYKNNEGDNVTVSTDKNIVVEGDGSTVVNVYYQYKEYTLRFYYAATEGGTSNDNDNDANTYDSIKIVGGTTYYFGYFGGNTSDDEKLLENEYFNYSGQWGSVSALPTLNDEGMKKNYTIGSETFLHNTTSVTYHYISFKARYNDNIADMWPCGVFNSATRTDKNNANRWNGTEAFVSAWNGEHHVKYSRNSNQTIKGVYEILDENLLFHSDYTDESVVSYLCFWENGANIDWSVPELYRYKIWLEGNAPNNEETVTRDGITYYLADVYDTCDDSDVSEQTQPGLTGYTPFYYPYGYDSQYSYWQVKGSNPAKYFEYKTLTGTTDPSLLSQSGYYDSSLYSEGYDVNFYYSVLEHTLKFMNHNDWLTDGTGVPLNYGTSLKKYGDYVNATFMAMPQNYPETLEPGAYEFAGWYTTSACLDGTEVDWETLTMPNSDLTVYAYWKPVVHNVYFYYDYSDYFASLTDDDKEKYYWYHYEGGTKVPGSYPIPVTHGNLLGTTYSNTPEANDGFTFVGWFYIDETGKKRFAPDTMEVKKDLHLFAEWQSGIDTQYEVSYELAEAAGTYPAGTTIANMTTGHLTAGKTKTFTAKVETELLPDFQTMSLFPTINSHSILMDQQKEHNRFTFTYVHDDEVYYRVRYLDKITGLELRDEKIETSTHAIVTEKFVPINGYLPDNYYIRKVLAADGDASEPSELNEIIFYYTPDEFSGLFIVEYYTENLDGTWYLEQSEIGSDDLGSVINRTIDVNKFNGFQYNNTKVTSYVGGSEQITEYNSSVTSVSGVVTKDGLEIRVYYSRNSYPYFIRYVEYGTGVILEQYTYTALDAAKYKSDVSATAPYEVVKDGITYLFDTSIGQSQTQTMSIRASDTENVLTFYFRAKTVSIYYEAVCLTPGAVDFGGVSLNFETAATLTNLSGSEAISGVGFKFIGWYSDNTCQNQVSTNVIYKPTELPEEDEVTYYALFEPIFSSLTIYNQISDNAESQDSFLFRVQGTGKTSYIDLIVCIHGNSSVTLKNLPIGEYTVTLLDNWSWENSTETPSKTVTVPESPITTTFESLFQESNWLDDETSLTNRFTDIHTVAP